VQPCKASSNIDLNSFVANRCEAKSISCKSIIVTVFGDLVSQHGGWIWLGSLIQALAPLGFSERLIRTSVFRLVQDDWLQVEKVGRKSFYAFTETASQHYTKAARRIYAGSSQHSDGNWLIVIPSFVPDSQMQSFKRQLRWLGFSSLASGTLAHPSIDKKSLEETLEEMALTDKVIVLEGRTIDQQSDINLKQLVEERWELDSLEQGYREFVRDYSEIESSDLKADPELQFLIRTLLIHEFRRILLKDLELPKSMLHENWAGESAYQLTKRLYKTLAKSSSLFVTSEFECQQGKLPQAIANFEARFN
ncbi:MAG: hypothetical protein OQJ89_11400, partial [Kangiellaceae bacterium]|nr:hypothetical protein [Kangiellaceae bacterium]